MKLVLSVVVASLLFIGCSEESQKAVENTPEAKKISEEIIQKSEELTTKAQEIVEKTVEKTQEVTQEITKEVQEASAEVQEVSKQVVQQTKKTINEAAKEVQEATAPSIDAVALYKSCAGCHGANGEKVALGKSKVIQGWSVSDLESALNGYKDGTYGGSMKAVMKGQANKLSEEEIKALAEYISKF